MNLDKLSKAALIKIIANMHVAVFDWAEFGFSAEDCTLLHQIGTASVEYCNEKFQQPPLSLDFVRKVADLTPSETDLYTIKDILQFTDGWWITARTSGNRLVKITGPFKNRSLAETEMILLNNIANKCQ